MKKKYKIYQNSKKEGAKEDKHGKIEKTKKESEEETRAIGDEVGLNIGENSLRFGSSRMEGGPCFGDK